MLSNLPKLDKFADAIDDHLAVHLPEFLKSVDAQIVQDASIMDGVWKFNTGGKKHHVRVFLDLIRECEKLSMHGEKFPWVRIAAQAYLGWMQEHYPEWRAPTANTEWKKRQPSVLDIRKFAKIHVGETCVVIGNGPSLNDIPNSFLEKYPSFGCNFIHMREGFTPTYYVTGDWRVIQEQGAQIAERFSEIPKFVPTPGSMDRWKPRGVCRFKRSGVKIGLGSPVAGMSYKTVVHIAVQLAIFMGFTTILVVGIDGGDQQDHFYGIDPKIRANEGRVRGWEEGYSELMFRFPSVKILNVSERSTLTALPRGDWRDYVT